MTHVKKPSFVDAKIASFPFRSLCSVQFSSVRLPGSQTERFQKEPFLQLSQDHDNVLPSGINARPSRTSFKSLPKELHSGQVLRLHRPVV